jgi:hypothetical protein
MWNQIELPAMDTLLELMMSCSMFLLDIYET